MSKITRRSIPALLASATGLAAGFIAAAKADSGLDPIYEKINRVAEADKTYSRLAAAHEKAERRYFDKKAKLPIPKHDGTELRTDAAVDSYVNGLGLSIDVRATLHKVLARHGEPLAERFEPTPEDLLQARKWDALRERLHAEVAAYETAIENVQVETGVDVAEEATTRAMRVRDDLAEAVLATMPTTLAGAAALIGFAQREVDIYGNDEPATKALATLASFLSRVA
jgi:hypothetical protein